MSDTPDTRVAERCGWCGSDPQYVEYHDRIWGRPVSDDRELFAKLCLDGQQAGLSWITILRKQANYEAAFDGFDPERIARYDADKVASLLENPGIIRNRLKVESIIRNARAFLAFQEAGRSFSEFLWSFVEHRPIQGAWRSLDQVPTTTPEAEAMSRALKKQGFNFVGPTIVYAFMQAVGLVNDHLWHCPQHAVCAELAGERPFPR
ncbi:DNA-3-methyladenine glycosylase I [Marinobacter bohaiensis]|uniref:DNA-3-methyladenine glycosylase I n=1 Tax=Marinobacter bohaiensis TaxID=2201898 RepID=UPI000DAD21BE|nr:DNA-3-methyladenine glycosylase I [Marinobacter bohaiensis]